MAAECLVDGGRATEASSRQDDAVYATTRPPTGHAPAHIIPSLGRSAFVPGRMITNNTIIAFECFHKIHQTKNGRDTHCAYKLDLAKAYDRVDWHFPEDALKKVGFNRIWTDWVMNCVKSVRFSGRCNGKNSDYFNPSRGLWQGDP
ncbi:uncharacterized protein [Aegilops tauschii subsp. strangulata]|uniref:uncharacterized protein n=1 Tax=Aegilops tauschii subsp. strangulata TaxID=200361 RepID=UPI00098AD1D5|nr:uncharacterized protein LOC109780708 [Aegilops tauschii subsp. strangulata]